MLSGASEARSSGLIKTQLFREHGSKVIQEVTLDQVYGGARGIKALVWEVRAQLVLDSVANTCPNKPPGISA